MPQQTTSSGPPDWMQPYYQQYLNGAFGVANRPYQQYPGRRTAGMSDIQQQALGGIQGSMGGSGGPARGFVNGLMGGRPIQNYRMNTGPVNVADDPNWFGPGSNSNQIPPDQLPQWGGHGAGQAWGSGPQIGFMDGPNAGQVGQVGGPQFGNGTKPMMAPPGMQNGRMMTSMAPGRMQPPNQGGGPGMDFGGGGMPQNPYIDQLSDTVMRDATRQFESTLGNIGNQYTNPNSFGGPRMGLDINQAIQGFGRGVGDALGGLRYGAHENAQNRGLEAARLSDSMDSNSMSRYMMALQAGNIPRDIQQQFYDTDYADWRDAFEYPQRQVDSLGRALGVGGQFQQQTTNTPNPSRTSQWAGGAMMMAPWLFGWGK